MIRVEYDDGKPMKRGDDRSPLCTPKGRAMGMYAVLPDGSERPLHIGFLRVSEMEGLEKLLNEVADLRR